jgi:hypothetical protein|tara:strand:- start:104 stop:625 length:522 start_codon:yes stop_codon:yes gene_type:complete
VANRGGLNIDYTEGFKLEEIGFKRYYKAIKHVLHATEIESTARTMMDKSTGVDLTAKIQGHCVGVSLRVRNKDYNSFTLNRHVNDKHSEILKWTTKRNNFIKPAYHVQIAPIENGVKVWRINIDAFSHFINRQIKTSKLISYYNNRLKCYEFSYENVLGVAGVTVFELDNSFT